MSGEHVENGLSRIERALERLERMVERSSAERQSLEARHTHLRQAVTSTLEELDALIADHAA